MTRLRKPSANSTMEEIAPRESLNKTKRLDGAFDHRQVESGAPMVNNESIMRHGNITVPFDLCSRVVLLIQKTKWQWSPVAAKTVGKVSFIQNTLVQKIQKTIT